MNVNLKDSTKRFKEKFKLSGELARKGSAYIPAGFSRHSMTYGPHAIYVERGKRQHIYTVEGYRLLDFHNNFSCNVLGHNHPKIVNSLLDMIPNGFSFGNAMEHEHRLAQMLCERLESVERIIFSCSASESCLCATRIARAYTGKNKIAKFEGGYHGIGDDFLISMRLMPELFPGPARHPIGVLNSTGIPFYTRENVVVLPQNDLESCERILEENARDLACVIMELQTGAGGLIVFDKEFVHGIRAITHKLGILMIIDETISLRADYHGLQGRYKVKPDLTVMGKLIGGGLPLGAVGGREEYFNEENTGHVHHSGTHHAHPLAVKAGIACLEVMNKSTYERINRYADRIKIELNRWSEQENYPFQVYGVHSNLGYAFTDKPGREFKSCRDLKAFRNEEQMLTFALEMANRDIFPLPRGNIALSEPMTNEDIDLFIETAKDIVDGILKT
jgi:glutamate-1-semialdehyde 2,1-aminomutase